MSTEIKGSVAGIRYHNEGNGYSIFSLKLEKSDKETICVGSIDPIVIGDYVVASGEYILHPNYGKQFKADYIRRDVPTNVNTYADYLVTSISGIGSTIAKRIVKHFGCETFNVIEKKHKKLADINGISLKKAEKIYEQFMSNQTSREEQMFFIELGLKSYIGKLKKQYGSQVKEIIYTNPYKLIDDIKGIGFAKADEIAQKSGIPKTSVFRIYHGILFVLESNISAKGNVYLPKNILIEEAVSKLEVDEELVEKTLLNLIDDRKLIMEDNRVYLPVFFYMEEKIAHTVVSMCTRPVNITYNDEKLENQIKKIEKSKNRILDETQRKAVVEGIKNNILIITGGPGTGKTTTIDTLITYLEKVEHKKIKLAAPTGRAAKRMNEQTRRPAQTIHRLIGLQIEDNERVDGIDADVVIIDETSMVDISLMHSLLKAMDIKTKLILVGDVDQLPSVGPGTILKDLIKSGVVPVVKLTKIHRQDSKSTIIPNAHKINKGVCPNLYEESNDFFFIKRNEVNDGLNALLVMALRNTPHHFKIKPTDVQVLAPMKSGPLGVNNLNKVLQERINPRAKNKKEIKFNNETIYRVGDKVMHIKNDYNLEWKKNNHTGSGVFNGEVGYITNIENSSLIVVLEDGRMVTYTYEDMKKLTLAYAITIHKSQGSEYPAIIIPLVSGGPPMLYNRMLLYTAVTRASKCVIIIGKEYNIKSMIKNISVSQRYTYLTKKMQEKVNKMHFFEKIPVKKYHINNEKQRKRGTKACKIKKIKYKWKKMKSLI